MHKVLVLNYHEIVPANSLKRVKKMSYGSIDESLFQDQIGLIKKLNIPCIPLRKIADQDSKSKLRVVITFDDGNASDFTKAYPILRQNEIEATFFPIVELVNSRGYLNWKQIKELSDQNIEIGSHGLSHKNLAGLTINDCALEVTQSKSILENEIGEEVTAFSLPYGSYNNSVSTTVKEAGYKSMLTTRSKINYKHDFIIHRYNITNNVEIGQFRQLLLENKYYLAKKQLKSTIAFLTNKYRPKKK